MASPIACGVSDLHHPYITHGAITCNGRQTKEKNPAYLSEFCKCVQSLETSRISLLMSRSAVRVRSPALRSPCKSCKKIKTSVFVSGLCQQYVSSKLSQGLVLGIGVLRVVAGYRRWRMIILWHCLSNRCARVWVGAAPSKKLRPGAEKFNTPNFAQTEFSEVGLPTSRIPQRIGLLV